MAKKVQVSITGLEEVLKNLNKVLSETKGKTYKGLLLAGMAIRKDMDTTSPITPVDTRNLDHSFILTTVKSTQTNGGFSGKDASQMATEHSKTVSEMKSAAKVKEPVLIMGYSANYAIPVHEMIQGNIQWQRPKSGAKWFEYALSRNYQNIINIVKENIKID